MNERVEKEEKEQIETERQVMKERYRRYHEKNDLPVVNDGVPETSQEAVHVSQEPAEEVVTKTDATVQENLSNEHVTPAKSSSKKSRKKKSSLFKSNKVTPLIQADESWHGMWDTVICF